MRKHAAHLHPEVVINVLNNLSFLHNGAVRLEQAQHNTHGPLEDKHVRLVEMTVGVTANTAFPIGIQNKSNDHKHFLKRRAPAKKRKKYTASAMEAHKHIYNPSLISLQNSSIISPLPPHPSASLLPSPRLLFIVSLTDTGHPTCSAGPESERQCMPARPSCPP